MSKSESKALVLTEFKKSAGWKLVQEKIEEKIQSYTDVLTGDAEQHTICTQFNERIYNKYDLTRIVRKMLIELKDIPDQIINSETDPIQQLSQYE